MNNYVAIALLDKNKVLMQLRDNKSNIYEPNKWNLPGGKCKIGESLDQAIRREFKEETGYVLKNPKKINTLFMSYEKGDYNWHIFTEEFDDKQEIRCYEGQKMEFLTLEELRKMDLARKNLEVLEFVFSSRF